MEPIVKRLILPGLTRSWRPCSRPPRRHGLCNSPRWLNTTGSIRGSATPPPVSTTAATRLFSGDVGVP
jgi:hypothetical protein